jgi:hypothetical protein
MSRQFYSSTEDILTHKIILLALCGILSTSAWAQSPAAKPTAGTTECETKAVSKDGKPLAGAAKAAFIKKCEAESTAPANKECEAKAVSKDGKPLAGAAKAAFMKKCEAEASGSADTGCEAKAVSKDGKPLAGAAKATFMKKCEAEAKAPAK